MPLQRGARWLDATVADHYAAICAVLWSERNVLESLACTAVVGQLIPRRRNALAVRPPSPTEIGLIERLQLQEVLRAAMVDELMEVLPGDAPATLGTLADTAPEPWATMFREHRDALRVLLDDVTSLGVARQRSLAEFLG
ncbi:MAG TPA: hypothetical protein VJ831_06585 [Jatrophihabitantaceae bacterium]|nr:hypothetical protein [Jatrophihabitantaceae bacterium]